jgi:hypothetical protein
MVIASPVDAPIEPEAPESRASLVARQVNGQYNPNPKRALTRRHCLVNAPFDWKRDGALPPLKILRVESPACPFGYSRTSRFDPFAAKYFDEITMQ